MTTSSRVKRWLLPALAFKAVVIGGGYATGRELVEFFLPSGPLGGVFGMLLATALWSAICALTFLTARSVAATDYGSFFNRLLGPAAPLFDVVYLALVTIVLSVAAAAAGEIAHASLGWPPIAGTLLLMSGVALVTGRGNASVESLFKYVAIFLYGVYAVFVILVVLHAGDRIADAFTTAPAVGGDWVLGGLTYAGYNVIAAIAILPVTRHFQSRRDAVIAGLLCGPLAMLPALLFFVCMVAWYPSIASVTLPSDYVLSRIDAPAFRAVFQAMIFLALLETGAGLVHSANERIAGLAARRGATVTLKQRTALSLALLVFAVFVAAHLGLVALIASGYRVLALLVIAVFVVPLVTRGVWLVVDSRRPE